MPLLEIISRLRTQLVTSGLQKRDNPLFQVINQLIGLLQDVGNNAQTAINNIDTGLADADFITWTDESTLLPNSRNLLAGTGITFDDSIANERTINSSAGVATEWSVLTNGEVTNPELVFAGGDVVMLHIP